MSSLAGLLQQPTTRQLLAGAALLFLTAFYSPLTVLMLAPVYGSAPAHIFHGYGVAIVGAAGWFLKDHVQRLSGRRALLVVPVLAFWVPTVQTFLFASSSVMGNPFGAVVTEAISYYPLLLVSVACAGKLVQAGLDLGRHGDAVAEHVPLLVTYVLYKAGEKFAKGFLARFLGSAFFLSRSGLQLLLPLLYSVIAPSKVLLLALPSVLFSLTSNVHMHSGALNAYLHEEGFNLVARQDSVTGYLSVLDNLNDGFRVMRCDHSLLGGQWTRMPRNYNPVVMDPIYSVFTMLEAIRLVENDHREPRVDANSKALVIGLGVGTTPSALIHHGIETTIVEIDPVVHQFATEYFHLPSNHITVIEDATTFVQRTPEQYDYIVHDVFTGGAEPLELFTMEFLENLASTLKDDGVIAINYAGDISLYPAALTVRTIQHVFPTCRIFREESDSDLTTDFTNMVIFCKKSAATPLSFRKPVPADYMGSKFRENYLLPKQEVDVSRFQDIPKGGRRFLFDREKHLIHKWQDRASLEHWNIMRNVLPDGVWENW
ncbi:S-adenosyl-L-methionine-dependent methyltransferase [Aspergillus heteromorphus CBS 117.55]|uniref:S-adenosyl-L-methionine-dependent methyltransferase n=1 Tax=Aspergillus heteromorphus CBS 117.55 TaxID=1448321 RepID=A0A317X011_9EURO|nr:S-adenosyl-L-methionine-dependent methyltransferase [Aspergillus heteromorphus CBS 117.55]PWY90912.1 S-adenosyl-L-methionine-dependent methyltransferase [Aspergillus heteromorphus CBS 117.55]